jgi:predicted O-methyltransferase YrrM
MGTLTVENARYFADNLYRQLQDFTSLQAFLQPRFPLPQFRSWAISPDFGVVLLKELLRGKPRRVMELGSGVSTLISAYCLERQGGGKLLSIDHDEAFLEQTRQSLEDHGLTDYVEIRHAPLQPLQLEHETFEWYAVDALKVEPGIELLVVDGPPARGQSFARYPTLPVLHGVLAERAVVLMDDASRPDESGAIQRWCARWPQTRHDVAPCEKGASILRWSAAALPAP